MSLRGLAALAKAHRPSNCGPWMPSRTPTPDLALSLSRMHAECRAWVWGKCGTLQLCRMATLLAVLSANVLVHSPGDGLIFTTAVAQQQGHRAAPSGPEAVHNLSVVTQEWHRYPGLAVADIIFNNANDYEVRHPIIACDFLDPNGKVIATRGSTIFQSFPPASTTRINGVHFSLLRAKNAIPGSCRVLSVKTVATPH
jgi:hypothetical protein